MGAWRALAIVGCAVGCATEGPLLVAADGPDGGQTGAVDAALPVVSDAGTPPITGVVRPGMRIQYQLVGTVDTTTDVDFFVVDLFDVDADEVLALHDQGRVVAAYIASGSHEPWRPDADAFPASALGERLPSYPDERWIDVRDATVRALQAARIELAADKGFDAVHLVTLDAYAASSGFALTAADQVDYATFLADRAHALGLAAGLSSGWALADPLAASYDYAVHHGCLALDRCADLDPFRARGAPVFDLETSGTPEEVCPEAEALGLPVTLKREGFDGWLYACP